MQERDLAGEHAGATSVPAVELAATALTLARAFASGATLWCVAPRWPDHARHVAVEFVHPVVMGARALPAVAIVDPDPAASVRAAARPGDAVIAIGRGDDATLVDLARRAPAWGATAVWVGWGPRPAPSVADHVLWVDGSGDLAPHDGSIVRLYHLLWELTHVCFEHPGLLRDDGCDGDLCTTCGDEGVPGEVVGLDGPDALVRTARGLERVDVSLVEPVQAADLVLVHAGTAIARLEVAG